MSASKTIEFDQVVSRCDGLDIHKKEIVATVDGEGISRETRTYSSTTRSLTSLKEWLLETGVTRVAMERTGVYWKPVLNIPESGGFEDTTFLLFIVFLLRNVFSPVYFLLPVARNCPRTQSPAVAVPHLLPIYVLFHNYAC
ncbi:MAG: IS110 family transposase [Tannerella sp.]|nr:IS110 family transposase [Tannerella sp.]